MDPERCGRPQNKRHPGLGKGGLLRSDASNRGDAVAESYVGVLFSSPVFKIWRGTSRGNEPRSLDSESRALTVTPRGRLHRQTVICMLQTDALTDTGDVCCRRIGA